jgi:hypothetical protein
MQSTRGLNAFTAQVHGALAVDRAIMLGHGVACTPSEAAMRVMGCLWCGTTSPDYLIRYTTGKSGTALMCNNVAEHPVTVINANGARDDITTVGVRYDVY